MSMTVCRQKHGELFAIFHRKQNVTYNHKMSIKSYGYIQRHVQHGTKEKKGYDF